MLDNIGHASDAAKRAKGVSAKSDRADLTLTCESAPGGLIVRTRKVRSVRAATRFGDVWLFHKDDQTLERQHADGFKPTTIMDHVCRLIENEPGITTTAILGGIKSKREHVSTAIRELVDADRIRKVMDGRTATYYPLEDSDAFPQVPLTFPPAATPSGTAVPTGSQRSRAVPTGSQPPSDRRFPSFLLQNGEGTGTTTDPGDAWLRQAIADIGRRPPEEWDAAWAALEAQQNQAAA